MPEIIINFDLPPSSMTLSPNTANVPQIGDMVSNPRGLYVVKERTFAIADGDVMQITIDLQLKGDPT